MKLSKKVADPEHTILFLSGSSYPGEKHVMKNLPRLAHVGVLFSYADLKEGGLTWRRMINLTGIEPSIITREKRRQKSRKPAERIPVGVIEKWFERFWEGRNSTTFKAYLAAFVDRFGSKVSAFGASNCLNKSRGGALQPEIAEKPAGKDKILYRVRRFTGLLGAKK